MTRSTARRVFTAAAVFLGACSGDKITDTSKLTQLVIIPPSAQLRPSGDTTFLAGGITSTGDTGVVTTVAWSATGGTITTGGHYTAPATLGTYYVRATAGALIDSVKVTVDTDSVVLARIIVLPATVTLLTGGSQTFVALGITTKGDTTLIATPSWSTTGGSVNGGGNYTAPGTAGTYYVRAQFSTFKDSARVTVNSSTGAGPYFTENFDSYTLDSGINGQGANGFQWRISAGDNPVVVSRDVAHSGNQSLKFTYRGVPADSDDWEEQYFILKPTGQGLSEVWMEWYVYFPSTYAWRCATENPNNNKLFYLWAETYSVPSDMEVGLEYQGTFSHPCSPNAHTTIRSAPQGTNITDGDGNSVRGVLWDTLTVAGAWHQVRFHARVGTSDGSDKGVFQAWFDGTQIVQTDTNYWMYTNIAPANDFFRNGYLMGWANAGYLNNTSFYIDDVKVYSSDPKW